MIELEVDIFSNALLVSPEIWNFNLNKFSRCRMAFDTGASMTTIDTDTAKRAGYKLKGAKEVIVEVVGGRISVKKINVPNFKLGGEELGTVTLYVTDFAENANVTALLGLNIIQHFVTTIDVDRYGGIIKLVPKFNLADKIPLDRFNESESRFGIWHINNFKQP
jgi:hypothetical protein